MSMSPVTSTTPKQSPNNTPTKHNTANNRPCWRCSKCIKIQQKLDAIDNEYREVRTSLLEEDTSNQQTSPKRLNEISQLRDQARQLRITIDTIMRAQLFELHETFLSN